MEKLLDILTPENVSMALMVILVILTKNKIVSERVRGRVKKMLEEGEEIGEITDRTVATVEKVKAVMEETVEESRAGDSTRKKAQRVFRKALRGWMGF